jgi:hypothetical protein
MLQSLGSPAPAETYIKHTSNIQAWSAEHNDRRETYSDPLGGSSLLCVQSQVLKYYIIQVKHN